jgi:hypothetical protein
MEYQLKITDEDGTEYSYSITRSNSDEPNNLNDFILQALSVSEDKRKLPFLIRSPNGLESFPCVKMKFENYGSSILGDKLEAIVVTWGD